MGGAFLRVVPAGVTAAAAPEAERPVVANEAQIAPPEAPAAQPKARLCSIFMRPGEKKQAKLQAHATGGSSGEGSGGGSGGAAAPEPEPGSAQVPAVDLGTEGPGGAAAAAAAAGKAGAGAGTRPGQADALVGAGAGGEASAATTPAPGSAASAGKKKRGRPAKGTAAKATEGIQPSGQGEGDGGGTPLAAGGQQAQPLATPPGTSAGVERQAQGQQAGRGRRSRKSKTPVTPQGATPEVVDIATPLGTTAGGTSVSKADQQAAAAAPAPAPAPAGLGKDVDQALFALTPAPKGAVKGVKGQPIVLDLCSSPVEVEEEEEEAGLPAKRRASEPPPQPQLGKPPRQVQGACIREDEPCPQCCS